MSETQNLQDTSAMTAFVELASGLWINQALSVAARLGVADFLKDGAKTTDELAQATETYAPSLYRLLRSLASVGVFTEVEPRRFALTPMGEYLREDNPFSLRYQAIMHCSDCNWPVKGEMYQTIKDGTPAIKAVFQVDNYFEYMEQHPEEGELFGKAVVGILRNFCLPLLKEYDFSGFTKVVGQAGPETVSIPWILKNNPQMQGVLFGPPPLVADAAGYAQSEGVAERCETIEGDPLDAFPSGGDLYSVSYTLIETPDESCVKMLQNIRRAMKDNGKVIVVDSLILPGEQYLWNKWLDVEEMTLGIGKVRTEEEFKLLFEAADFNLTRIITKEGETPAVLMELVPA